MSKKYKYILGIDEAGRGPLAGPVSVGGTIAQINFSSFGGFHKEGKISKLKLKMNDKIQTLKFDGLDGIKDSKKLTAKKRDEWREKLTAEDSEFYCEFVLINNEFIDKEGISKSLKVGIQKLFDKFEESVGINSDNCFVVLDGLLSAPVDYGQESFFKGDEKIPLISAASIIAKVGRDRQMMIWHEKFPEYCFDKHKGYGTALHFQKIQEYGFCPIHRKTFCTRVF